MQTDRNGDSRTIAGFGDEWMRFDQSALPDDERQMLFDNYFSIFPWHSLPKGAVGFDVGCGSGRWARIVAPKVGTLHCIDPSEALDVARKNLGQFKNCEFHRATVDAMPFENASMDFGYCLGVLHHVPDTLAGLEACVKKLKPGAPFLVYLYYSFDNRPMWFRTVWRMSDVLRRVISRLPYGPRYVASQVIALAVYLPLARFAWAMEKIGLRVSNFPLSTYRHCSFYSMRTDALDRFGTRLEQRFSRAQIHRMMEKAGLEKIRFSEKEPFWCCVGYRKSIDRGNS